MQTNITWTGQLYHSIEHCTWEDSATGNEIVSTITGTYENKIYTVEYRIETNVNWETKSVRIHTKIDNTEDVTALEKIDEKWFLNGVLTDEFNAIYDIDISLTPFTNTLPVRRLKLMEYEKQVIAVIYFDVLEKQIKPVKQIYTRLTGDKYRYENYDKSFTADIHTDEDGLVKDYPTLFEMTAKQSANT
jgi:hypothetical protein